MSEQRTLSIELSEEHPAYQWAKRQSDSVEAFGHIGTHIDCYTKTPVQDSYDVKTVSLDCRTAMPTLDDIANLDLQGKAVVLFSGNLDINEYGTPAYGKMATHLDSVVLGRILEKGAAFIMIDSYGIGAHGEEHISFDKLCEEHDCFVVENIHLTDDIVKRMTNVSLKFDRSAESTGKRCQVIASLSEVVICNA